MIAQRHTEINADGFALIGLIFVVSSEQRAGSSARLERSTDNRKVAGSNPARPTSQSHLICLPLGVLILISACIVAFIKSFSVNEQSQNPQSLRFARQPLIYKLNFTNTIIGCLLE